MNPFRRWHPVRWDTPFSDHRAMDVTTVSYASRALSAIVCASTPEREPLGSWAILFREALAVEMIPEVALVELWRHVSEKLRVDWSELGSTWTVPDSPWFNSLPWREGLALAAVMTKDPGPATSLTHFVLNGETTSLWVASARAPEIRQLTRGRHATEEEALPFLLGIVPPSSSLMRATSA